MTFLQFQSLVFVYNLFYMLILTILLAPKLMAIIIKVRARINRRQIVRKALGR